MTTMTTTPSDRAGHAAQIDADRYDEFRLQVVRRFARLAEAGPVFTTDAEGLWRIYLDAAPAVARPSRTCVACRRFIEAYGGLVAIDERGATVSALWPEPAEVPPAYAKPASELALAAMRARVTGVFLASEAFLGTPSNQAKTGAVWTHTYLEVPEKARVREAGTRMAERREEYGMLARALAEFPVEVVRKAHALLSSEALYRSEKVEGVARWLLELHERRAQTRHDRLRENLTWLAVAKAPPGFCHVRASMIGTLLEDLAAGTPFEAVRRRFDEKMHPSRYQRPTAAPTDANIAQAEKIVAELGTAGALDRRFARLSDLGPGILWSPPPAERPTDKGAGVFGHLKSSAKQGGPIETGAPPKTMTWAKFSREVLSSAESIELLVAQRRASFLALVTAARPEAPPILQWDRPEARNPVSWYLYQDGSPPSQWNVSIGYNRVTAIVRLPPAWGDRPLAHHGDGVVLLLAGARDTRYACGAGLFPEILRSEYHGVRRTIEAYAARAVIAGRDEAEGCGLDLRKGQSWDATVRVTAGGISTLYRLDRWD